MSGNKKGSEISDPLNFFMQNVNPWGSICLILNYYCLSSS